MMTAPWQVAWIAGASTGIGRALALDIARRGVKVAVSARNAERLVELAAEHAGIAPYPLDVTDQAAVEHTVAAIEAAMGPIGLAVLNAGVGKFMPARQFNVRLVREAVEINYMGAAHGLAALLPRMIERGSGQIALTASVAGYSGVPRSGAYSPTKAALINLAEALYPDAQRFGIKISVINPGFVDTPMTAVNRFKMPFLLTAEDASKRILSGLEKGKFEIAFPWQTVWTLKALRAMPYPLYFWFQRKFAMGVRP
jgi:short-subunit dehydrogenase